MSGVTLNIPICAACPYIDHSGAFTPGGAKDVCGHKQAYQTFGSYDWKSRVVDRASEPPLNCPLRRQEKHDRPTV